MKLRPATLDEMLACYDTYLRQGWRVSFRHFTRELYAPNAKNGVKHVRHGKAKLHAKDDGIYARHQGKLQRLQATHYTLDDGKTGVGDLRIDSPYLP